jgi:hypothetical protein
MTQKGELMAHLKVSLANFLKAFKNSIANETL